MLSSIQEAKSIFVDDLWLPLAIIGGDCLFPYRKKHKVMNLFTLTDMDCIEVKKFEANKLIHRENVVAWNPSYQQAIRLETELGKSLVLFDGRFEDIIKGDSQQISSHFPFSILNLDYSSQKPSHSVGRIEKEILGIHILINQLNHYHKDGFVFLYTTLIDQIELRQTLLTFSINPPYRPSDPIIVVSEKVEFIKRAVMSILHNHNYSVTRSQELMLNLKGNENVFSMGIVSSGSI
jgi:hypothetical protein